MNDNIYNVDWRKLARDLTPPALRKPRFMALIYALRSAINDLHTRLVYYRVGVIYRLGITGQVALLERALNDRYDFLQRRIFLEEGAQADAMPLFQKGENKPVRIYRRAEGHPLVLYTKAETSQFSADFIVVMPAGLQFDANEVTAFVDTYKLASKTFKIKVAS